MAPRPDLHPDDLVTPAKAGELLGVDPRVVSAWIHRYGIPSLGKIGRWDVYDFREIAAVEARLAELRESPKDPDRALRLVPAA